MSKNGKVNYRIVKNPQISRVIQCDEPVPLRPQEKSNMPKDDQVSVETVNHPKHYGGADNPYEAIKVIEHWNLGFNLGNSVKYICRADHKGNRLEDLKKALFYLDREIQNTLKKQTKINNDG